MSHQTPERDLGRALRALLDDQVGATRFKRYQREIRRGGRLADGARPRESDSNGFPVPQPNKRFVERVARLINP